MILAFDPWRRAGSSHRRWIRALQPPASPTWTARGPCPTRLCSRTPPCRRARRPTRPSSRSALRASPTGLKLQACVNPGGRRGRWDRAARTRNERARVCRSVCRPRGLCPCRRTVCRSRRAGLKAVVPRGRRARRTARVSPDEGRLAGRARGEARRPRARRPPGTPAAPSFVREALAYGRAVMGRFDVMGRFAAEPFPVAFPVAISIDASSRAHGFSAAIHAVPAAIHAVPVSVHAVHGRAPGFPFPSSRVPVERRLGAHGTGRRSPAAVHWTILRDVSNLAADPAGSVVPGRRAVPGEVADAAAPVARLPLHPRVCHGGWAGGLRRVGRDLALFVVVD